MKKPQSSFGLPDDLKRQIAERENVRRKEEAEKQPEVAEDQEEVAQESVEVKTEEKKKISKRNPEKEGRALLADIGVSFDETDFHNYLFRGSITKHIVVSKTKEFEFTAEIKTLTGQELDLADELLARDIEDLQMTRDGMMARRSVWYLSFGLKKLCDKPLVKNIFKPDSDKELDHKEMATERRKIILDLAPSVTDKLIRCQAVMTSALNLFIENKDTLFLDNAQAPASSTTGLN